MSPGPWSSRRRAVAAGGSVPATPDTGLPPTMPTSPESLPMAPPPAVDDPSPGATPPPPVGEPPLARPPVACSTAR